MQYRRAIRHPQPAEREYLAAQSTGTGVHVGKHVDGGWLVDAAMAESPAEEAGIVRGDRIIEISKLLQFVLSRYPTAIIALPVVYVKSYTHRSVMMSKTASAASQEYQAVFGTREVSDEL